MPVMAIVEARSPLQYTKLPAGGEGIARSSFRNPALSGLLFLYRDVLEIDLPWLDGIVRAKRPERLPVVLTRDEVRAVLQGLDGVPRLMACLLLHPRPESWADRGPEPRRPDVRSMTPARGLGSYTSRDTLRPGAPYPGPSRSVPPTTNREFKTPMCPIGRQAPHRVRCKKLQASSYYTDQPIRWSNSS